MMMGMLWFDNDPKTTLEQKVTNALKHHAHRFGRDADLVVVNTKNAEGIELDVISKACNVTVKAARYVMANHMIVGFEDQAMELANV